MSAEIRLEHVGILAPGERFEQTVRFYEHIFGWQRLRESSSPTRLVFLGDGARGALEILDVEGPAIEHSAHLAFAVPVSEFEAVHQRLAEAGVQFDPVSSNDAGDYLAFFNDPAGNRAQLVGRVSPLMAGQS